MITDRLLFIHIQRTGGLFVRGVLRQIPGLWIFNDHLHLSYDQMVAKCEGYIDPVPPALAFVRNPWSWYVSLWGRIWWDPTIDFVGSFREFMQVVKSGIMAPDPNFAKFSDHWRYMGGDKAEHIGRFEILRQDIDMLIGSHLNGLINPVQLRLLMASQPHSHPCREWPTFERCKPYWRYYDKELASWVKEWDGELIERFGYEFA